MKTVLALSLLLFLSAQPAAAFSPAQSARFLDTWSLMNTWDAGNRPLDFAQTWDKKLVFLLGSDGKVHVYSAVGEHLGAVPVATTGQPVAIDIQARGRQLYVVDQNGICTIYNISLDTGRVSASVRSRWRSGVAQPLDIAHLPERELVFILSREGEVRVHAVSGRRIGTIPADWGTVAINLVPRSRRMLLLQDDGTCSAVELLF